MREVKLNSLALGINNRREPTRLAAGGEGATFLYAADNVDIDAQGFVKRRAGTTRALEEAVHSAWDHDGQYGFAVIDGVLTRLDPAGAGLLKTPVRPAMPRASVSYSLGADGAVYWTNGAEIRRVVDNEDRAIATPRLDSAPVLSLTAGALRAGRYLYAFTVQGTEGESAATVVQQIDVPEGGGLELSDAVLDGMAVNLYLSGPNGEVLGQTQAATDGRFSVLAPVEGGRRCPTIETAPMPPGSIVRHFNGRMVVAVGRMLYFSPPYRYGLYEPASGYIPFPSEITVVEPCDVGLYICADKTYWLTDFTGSRLQELLPYGALAESAVRSPAAKAAYWQSPRGLVRADMAGGVQNLQEAAVAFGPAERGASLFRSFDGMEHVVSTRAGAEQSVAVARSYMDAEIVRKGTQP
ncbi:hypothetical protein GmRootV118_17800 [Variovorax sp. V118]|uniref:hypothetical protein n=1 Tax=Variovorax sp. V118 TaxID=3065954 RepID=UPI0034E87EE1